MAYSLQAMNFLDMQVCYNALNSPGSSKAGCTSLTAACTIMSKLEHFMHATLATSFPSQSL